jgi:hypothetical protein
MVKNIFLIFEIYCMCLGQVSPEVCILKETKSKVSCLDLGKLAYQMYNKKNVNMVMMSNNITHAVEGELFLLLFSIIFSSVLVLFDFRFSLL